MDCPNCKTFLSVQSLFLCGLRCSCNIRFQELAKAYDKVFEFATYIIEKNREIIYIGTALSITKRFLGHMYDGQLQYQRILDDLSRDEMLQKIQSGEINVKLSVVLPEIDLF